MDTLNSNLSWSVTGKFSGKKINFPLSIFLLRRLETIYLNTDCSPAPQLTCKAIS